MALNSHFRHNVASEQTLYEDLIIESMQFYGQDVYYIPREVINRDTVFDDAKLSRFPWAYRVECYIENTEGFDGDGELFSKFGVEIRDALTFIMARRRWNQEISSQQGGDPNKYYRPREGDVIHLPMSNSTFEIHKVEEEVPFFQLGNLPVFRIRCELFEYNDEDFDTGITEIDNIENFATYQYVLTMDSATNGYIDGESVSQATTNYTISGEVVKWDAVNKKVYLAHVGADDGEYHNFTTGSFLVGSTSGTTATPTLVEELQQIQSNAPGGASGEVTSFDVSAFEFVDWTESNPFGDPT